MQDILPLVGVRQVKIKGREGDDVIALICGTASNSILVVTEDKDMLQLVSPSVHVYRPMKEQRICVENFETEIKVPYSYFLLWKALIGDDSDNIKGIPKVGEVTVTRIISQLNRFFPRKWPPKLAEDWNAVLGRLKTVCEQLAAADTKGASRYRAVIDDLASDKSIVRRNIEMMDLSREVFTQQELDLAALSIVNGQKFNEQGLAEACGALEFSQFLSDWTNWTSPFRSLV
jgi:5'-3' exonuclease